MWGEDGNGARLIKLNQAYRLNHYSVKQKLTLTYEIIRGTEVVPPNRVAVPVWTPSGRRLATHSAVHCEQGFVPHFFPGRCAAAKWA